ncbi:MAG: magnesium transporter MgtC [Acidobacteria bacterium]|nr:MAG: magnesium transporter MgtC [Acidobacteriota bacterium]
MQPMMNALRTEIGVVLSTSMLRLTIAAILGGVIGLERQLKHKPAGLRTNIFICFGSALFTILSGQLAGNLGGDHTRIAAQIIPGIGFIGAGSILHARGSTMGLTTAATVFVVASVGMAAGGGLYITAVFATGVMLVALALLGQFEERLSLRSMGYTFEVTGKNTDAVLNELSKLLDAEELDMEEINAVSSDGSSRVVFSVKCVKSQEEDLNVRLHESSVFSSVRLLGSSEHE